MQQQTITAGAIQVRVMILLTWASLSAAETSKPDVATFRQNVAPLLAKYCLDCHGPEEPEAKLSLNAVNPDLFGGDDLETWRMIDQQVRFGEMPPEDADQPSNTERELLLKWIRQELLKTHEPNVVTDEKLLLPEFGNYVDHLALFGERRSHVTPSRPRIWRLRPDIYNTIVPRVGERISGLANALNALDGSEFKDFKHDGKWGGPICGLGYGGYLSAEETHVFSANVKGDYVRVEFHDGNRIVGQATEAPWKLEGVKLESGLRVLFAVGVKSDGSRSASRPALAIVK